MAGYCTKRRNSAIHRLRFGQKQFRLLPVRFHQPPTSFPLFSSSAPFSRYIFLLAFTHHNGTVCSRVQVLFDLTIIFTNNTSSSQASSQHYREHVLTDRPKAVSIKRRRRDGHVHDILQKNQNDIAQKLSHTRLMHTCC